MVQLRSTIDPRENLALVTDAASRAVRGGADVVVFPEATMYSLLRVPTQVAEASDGSWALATRCLAGDLGTTIIAGMLTKAPGARVYSTLLAAGESEGCYDKIHLFDAPGQHESETIIPGLRPTSIRVTGYGLGLAICYDVRFPIHFIGLALGGATAMVVCASWAPSPGKLYQWRTLMTARVMDSVSFTVAVDQAFQGDAEASGGLTGIGHSMTVDPTKWVLLELGAEFDLVFVDVDPERVVVTRETLPMLDGNRLRSL